MTETEIARYITSDADKLATSFNPGDQVRFKANKAEGVGIVEGMNFYDEWWVSVRLADGRKISVWPAFGDKIEYLYANG